LMYVASNHMTIYGIVLKLIDLNDYEISLL
jgi:hypothetical protein